MDIHSKTDNIITRLQILSEKVRVLDKGQHKEWLLVLESISGDLEPYEDILLNN
jgi:hypothetical protein